MRILCFLGIHCWRFKRNEWDYIYSPFVIVGVPAVFNVYTCSRCCKEKAKIRKEDL